MHQNRDPPYAFHGSASSIRRSAQARGFPGHGFAANAVRLQLHALAYNLANFLRTLALPAEAAQWSLTTPRQRLVKIGARIVRHGRPISFQMADVMVPRGLFQTILGAIAALPPAVSVRC